MKQVKLKVTQSPSLTLSVETSEFVKLHKYTTAKGLLVDMHRIINYYREQGFAIIIAK